jgi:hypothetical protein
MPQILNRLAHSEIPYSWQLVKPGKSIYPSSASTRRPLKNDPDPALADEAVPTRGSANVKGGGEGGLNGEYDTTFGDEYRCDWEDARTYQFIGVGGGRWYSLTLSILNPGDRGLPGAVNLMPQF